MSLESLLLIQHGDRKTTHTLRALTTVVGRDTSCDLFFVDRRMSRRHARFDLRDDVVELVDLGSRNGCWVNGARVSRQRLHPGDVIRIGSLRMSFFQEESAVPTPGSEDTSQTAPGATVSLNVSALDRVSELTPEMVAITGDETLVSEGVPEYSGSMTPPDGFPAQPSATLALGDAQPAPSGTVAVLPATRVSPPIPSRRAVPRPASLMSWSARLAAAVIVLGLGGSLIPGGVAFFKARQAFQQESLAHAETLVAALTELNRPFIADGRVDELTLALADQSPRVRGAWIVNGSGEVLLQSGTRTLAEIMTPVPPPDVQNVVVAGDYLLQRSIVSEGGNSLGAVLVAYEGVGYGGGWLGLSPLASVAVILLVFGLLSGFYLYLKRLTLGPVELLETQLGALERGEPARDLPARFREWEGIRKGMNRLRERVGFNTTAVKSSKGETETTGSAHESLPPN